MKVKPGPVIKTVLRAVLLSFVLVVGVVLAGTVLRWDRLCCVYTDIDINSGDVRHVRYVAFVPVSRNVVQTQFSKLVRNFENQQYELEWQPVSITGTLFHRVYINSKWSPAISICDKFVSVLKAENLLEDKQRELVTECLQHLQAGELDKITAIIERELLDRSPLESETPDRM